MKLYLGVTDTQWFRFLWAEQLEEVNFWQPGGGNAFKVLPVGGPFLFKLKAPLNAIGGVGFFASHTRLSLSVGRLGVLRARQWAGHLRRFPR